ncbi:Hypothetical predicted protein, partial [Pelobates cultripes]
MATGLRYTIYILLSIFLLWNSFFREITNHRDQSGGGSPQEHHKTEGKGNLQNIDGEIDLQYL